MKYDKIPEYIKAPEKLNAETLPYLKELTEQFPAFETAWILYLRNLKNTNDPTFEQELVHSAIHIHNRRKLYLFLNTKFAAHKPDEQGNESTQNDRDDIFNLIFAPDYQIEQSKTIETKNACH